MVFLAALVLFLLGWVVILATVSHDLIGLTTTLPVYATQAQRTIDEFVGLNPELAAPVTAVMPSTPDFCERSCSTYPDFTRPWARKRRVRYSPVCPIHVRACAVPDH